MSLCLIGNFEFEMGFVNQEIDHMEYTILESNDHKEFCFGFFAGYFLISIKHVLSLGVNG